MLGAMADTRIPAIKVILLPKDTNAFGTIFGGVILSHIDARSRRRWRRARWRAAARATITKFWHAGGGVPRARASDVIS
jgi:hypothetical protein